MSTDDTSYFIARAEKQLELAQRAAHPNAVHAHYEIATAYLDRAYSKEQEAPSPQR